MIDINLLPQHDVATQKEKHLQKICIGVIILVTTSLVIIEVLLILFSTYISLNMTTQTKKYDELIATLDLQEQTANDLKTIHNKVKGIKKIQLMRTDYGKTIDSIQKVFSTDATLTKLSLDTAGKVNLTASSPSVQSFGDLTDRLSVASSSATDFPFRKVLLDEITDKGSSIIFSLDMLWFSK